MSLVGDNKESSIPQALFPNRRAVIAAGASMAFFALAANVPYTALMALFDYDDVLRRPAGEALTLFHQRGGPLVIAWWGFALAAFGFAISAGLLGEAFREGRAAIPRWIVGFGIASGLIQTAALLRWTFVVPHLAAAYAGAPDGSAAQANAVAAYDVLNFYAGAALGEHLGQLLLAVWTAGVALSLRRLGGATGWIALAGLATLPFWLIGQSEMLAPATPGLPSLEVIPIAFMAWELWLVVLGGALVARAVRRG